MAYQRPQTLVYQETARNAGVGEKNMNAFIFGPNYELRRYTNSDEKALTGIGNYNPDADEQKSYPNKPSGSVIDQDFVKVFAENAWLKYFTSANPTVNPINVISDDERNKIKAAARILDGGAALTSGVSYNIGGYSTTKINLPETFYFYPAANFDLGTAEGSLVYVTTEGYEGSMTVPANATQAGVYTQGPSGLVFDFDNANSVKTIRVFTFNGDDSDSFNISINPIRRALLLDSTIAGTKVSINISSGSLAASWDNSTLTLEVSFQSTDTLSDIRNAIAGALTATDYLILSDLNGSGNGVSVAVEDQDGTAVSGDTPFIPDCFKINIFENAYTWKTANGVSRSAELLKDVEIGDRVDWEANVGGTTYKGATYVKGFEAETTLPKVGVPEASSDNQNSQSATDLSSGAAIIENDPDNQNNADTVNSKVYSLDGNNYAGDLTAGILEDDIVITVTKEGVKGIAEVSISDAAGIYSRTNVPVEDAGTQDGRIYIGQELYVDMKLSSSSTFKLGDKFTVSAVKAAFNAVNAPAVSGTYAGNKDTTYTIEVIRGGKFDRSIEHDKGITAPTNIDIEGLLNNWTGGDINDEYVLKCVTSGTAATAVWELSSQQGDNASNIVFPGVGAGNAITVGGKGLQLYLTGSTSEVIQEGAYFVIKVLAARPLVQITDSYGLDQVTSTIVSDGVPFSLGIYGLSAVFSPNTNGGLITGDKFTVDAIASKEGAVKTIILNNAIPEPVVVGLNSDGTANYNPTTLTLKLALKENSIEIPKEQHDPSVAPGTFNWVAGQDELTVNSGITLLSDKWQGSANDYLPLIAADLYVSYRAMLMDHTSGIFSLSDASEVATELGTIDPDNPLAYGVYKALLEADGKIVYFAAVASDDLNGYNAILDRIGKTDEMWSLVPLTTDPDIIAAVLNHCDAMSTPERKRWRVCIFGRDLAEGKDVVSKSTNPSGNDYMATVKDDPRVAGTQYTKVEFTEDAGLLSNVKVGDTVKLLFNTDAWGNETYVADTVAEIESNTVLYLSNGLDSEVSVARRTEIYHFYSIPEKATAEAAISQSYKNKRAIRVFPGMLQDDDFSNISAIFGAAAIAGAASSVYPQQGITNFTLTSFTGVPVVLNQFNPAQLDEIAAGGTLIIAQDTTGGNVYVRHQLTTAYEEGNLDESELSSVKNLDNICYQLGAVVDGYTGRYNATPELAKVIYSNLDKKLDDLGTLTQDKILGPQLILSEGKTKVVSVEVHPTLKDRIIAITNVQLPYSLNVVELHVVSTG